MPFPYMLMIMGAWTLLAGLAGYFVADSKTMDGFLFWLSGLFFVGTFVFSVCFILQGIWFFFSHLSYNAQP